MIANIVVAALAGCAFAAPSEFKRATNSSTNSTTLLTNLNKIQGYVSKAGTAYISGDMLVDCRSHSLRLRRNKC